MSDRTISTGRGGAGNMRVSTKLDKPVRADDLPHLQTKKFTTGRGGAGNMLPNIDPQTTRLAQDGDDEMSRLDLVPTRSRTVGRGGYGNNSRSGNKYSQGAQDEESRTLCEKISGMLGS